MANLIMDSQEAVRENFRKWSAKMRASHTDLGEFIVEFSQLEFTLRSTLGTALRLPDELSNILLSFYDFASLCKAWQLVMSHQHAENVEQVKAIFRDCMKINDERVRVAHGLWTWGSEALETVHVSRNSLNVGTYYAEPGQLRDLSKECQRLLQSVFGIGGVAIAAK